MSQSNGSCVKPHRHVHPTATRKQIGYAYLIGSDAQLHEERCPLQLFKQEYRHLATTRDTAGLGRACPPALVQQSGGGSIPAILACDQRVVLGQIDVLTLLAFEPGLLLASNGCDLHGRSLVCIVHASPSHWPGRSLAGTRDRRQKTGVLPRGGRADEPGRAHMAAQRADGRPRQQAPRMQPVTPAHKPGRYPEGWAAHTDEECVDLTASP